MKKEIIERDGIFEFKEILDIQDALMVLTGYADKIFDYLNTDKEKCFSDKVRFADFGNSAYQLFREFEMDRDATTVHTILGLNPEDTLKKYQQSE